MAGLDGQEPYLVAAEPDWPLVEIAVDPRPAEPVGAVLEAGLARYSDVPSGMVEVRRDPGVACFRGVQGLTPDAIVHPRLGMLAAVFAQWLPKRMAFHAGAFVSQRRAWGIVGGRGGGKSTLIAALARNGLPVLGDDTLVLDGSRCLPGVRCVDVRPDASGPLGLEGKTASVRGGARHRLPLDDAARGAPLAGWIFLSWSDAVSLRALPAPERLARIAACRGWHRRGVIEPAALLEVAAVPAWELARPRDWQRLPETVERVLELTR